MEGNPHEQLIIRNVHLPHDNFELARRLYDVYCCDGRVKSVTEVTEQQPSRAHFPRDLHAEGLVELDGRKGLLLPALCHAHIHLDKCFLLGKCDELVSGDFEEALRVTAKAKKGFPDNEQDLYDRGRRLIIESIESGVTVMRAHVEVDTTVNMSCLNVGLRLKKELNRICDVQIAAFAQDPLFLSSDCEHPGENYKLLAAAAAHSDVQAVGSAPYVEPGIAQAKRNIDLVLDLAQKHDLHADFHLDYNLEPSFEPLVWYVLDQLRARLIRRSWRREKHVCIGHATRLTLFSREEWFKFKLSVNDHDLPVTLVGLPQSDMYMMGRDMGPKASRGTLNVPWLAKEMGLKVAMAVNNVENAFTPQGPVDPLALCVLGVAIFQAGTKNDCKTLMEAVTINARASIGAGLPPLTSTSNDAPHLIPREGDIADFVLMQRNETLQSAVCNPCFERTTIKMGEIVANRCTQKYLAVP